MKKRLGNRELEDLVSGDCETCEMLKKNDFFASRIKKEFNDIQADETIGGWSKRNPLGFTQLGNSGWNIIHSMAAYYPDNPTDAQKRGARDLINAFSELYPCRYCAQDLKEYAKENPVQVDSRKQFSLWTCEAHNHINLKTDKPKFPCEKFEEFWGKPLD